MRARLLVLAAAVGSLAAPLSAQTTYLATGGDVILTPNGLGVVPFQLFLDAVGNSHRLIASSDGTSFTLASRGSVALTSFPVLGSLDLGFFSTGSPLLFTYTINGADLTGVDFYTQTPTGFRVQYAANGGPFVFTLDGISSATGLQCPGATRLATCTLLPPPVTSTPEPGTIALFATGLAGLIPVVIRRRRAASQS